MCRKDNLNVFREVDQLWSNFEESPISPFQIDSNQFLRIRYWKAHTAGIIQLKQLKSVKGLVSASSDHHVKLWSYEGVLWGDIDILSVGSGLKNKRSALDTEVKWTFPFPWIEKAYGSLGEVIDLLEITDKKKFSRREKDYMIDGYFTAKYV
jgi:hypothetical protein